MKKISMGDISIITLITAFFTFIICLIFICSKTTEYRYDLQEVDNGVYAIYYNTYSRVPAQNYEVVTVCSNNSIYTFKGNIQISYVDTKPYATVKQCNLVNSDEIYICVPKGTAAIYRSTLNWLKFQNIIEE